MANIKSAQKQARQNEKHRKINLARNTAIKTAIKKVVVSIEQKQAITKSAELIKEVEIKLARAKSKGVMHKNTASRKLSRLMKRFNKVVAAQVPKETQ